MKCAIMIAADLAARRPPRPPRPRFILALFRAIFTLAALAICQSTSPSSLSPSQTRTSALTGTFKPFTKGMGNAKKRTALVIGKTANQAIGMLVPWGKQRLNVSYTRSRMQQDIGSGLLRWARPSTPNPPMGGGWGSAGGGGGGGSAGGATNPSVRTPD